METQKKTKHGDIISKLFQLHVDTHFLHLTTQSYAVHKALDMAYESLGEFKDSVAEKMIGYYGREFVLNVQPPTNTVATLS